MQNLSEMLKGVMEGIVLEIIGRGEVYGYEIVRKLGDLGFEGVSEGTVYTILTRLERNRLVKITKRPSELGPPRKFYTLNEAGMEELAGFWQRWQFLSERIRRLQQNGGDLDELQP